MFEKAVAQTTEVWGGFDKKIELHGDHCLEVEYLMDGADIGDFTILHIADDGRTERILHVALDQGDVSQAFTTILALSGNDTLRFKARAFPGLASSVAITQLHLDNDNCEDNYRGMYIISDD